MPPKKLLFVILDGWGEGEENEYNAVYMGDTPYFDRYKKEGKFTTLHASGEHVGLLPHQIGSSEVGHMHIGAGRVVQQELTKVHTALKEGSFFINSAFVEACDRAILNNSALHLVGILSDGGVHSHIDHFIALLKCAGERGVDMNNVFVHAFLDGRDTPPHSASKYLQMLDAALQKYGGTLATLCGRTLLDRNLNWTSTQKAVDLIVKGEGTVYTAWRVALEVEYASVKTDEFVSPIVCNSRGTISQNDSVIFTHFRADRMRQLAIKLKEVLPHAFFVSFIPYGEGVETVPAFIRDEPVGYFSEVLSAYDIPHVKITETQKYPHLTYFLNGTREAPYKKEERVLIPSLDIPSFDAAPHMSAFDVAQAVRVSIGKFPVILVNFANPDMVGHSGNLSAAIQAVEYVDNILGSLVPHARTAGYDVIITADHGNVEEMFDTHTNSPYTAHTTNPVPFILLSSHPYTLADTGGLTHIAPAMLELLGIKKPSVMDRSLFI